MRLLQAPRTLTAQDLARSSVPSEFWSVSAQRVPVSVKPAIENYISRYPEMASSTAGLILQGGQGTGKTSIAVLVLKTARSWGCSTYFTSIFDLREALRAKQQHEDDVSVFDRCREVDVLVLDNLRLIDESAMYVNFQLIEDLLMARGSRGKISILTTQISMREFVEKGKFLANLERYMVCLNVTGEDLRKQKTAALKATVLGSKE